MKKMLLIWAMALISFVSFAQDKKESVHIYNPEANAKADIAAAVMKAKAAKKHVFIQVGGNWCPWCIAFHNLIEQQADLKKYISDNFETVLVNYSKENKNLETLAALGYPQRFGFPVFLVLDGNGKVLHIQNSGYLETDETDVNGKKKVGHDVKKITDFLKGWTYNAVDPETYSGKK